MSDRTEDPDFVALLRERDELRKESDRKERLIVEWMEEGRKHVSRLRVIDGLNAELAALRALLVKAGEALFPLAYGEEIIGDATAYSEAKFNARTVLAEIRATQGQQEAGE
jgi:hypothetical protein